MSARPHHLHLVILTTLAVSACADPTPRERAIVQRETDRTLTERAKLAQSGRFLARRGPLGFALSDADGQALVDALDIPKDFAPTFVSAVSADPEATFVRASYGIIRPTSGGTFLMLSTGASGNETINAEPGTDLGLPGPDDDISTLQFKVTVPAGVNRMSFDYTFLSAESPEFVGSAFNDTFTASVTDDLGTDRVVTTASVNSTPFHPASDTSVGPCPFQLYVDTTAGVSTVFNQPGFALLDAGTTGVQHVDVPIAGGATGTVTITFDIRDFGDGILDSAVILDNVRFSALEAVDPRGADAATTLIDGDGQVIHAPDDRLVTNGVPVRAAATDGVTELLLRSDVSGPGEATFSIKSGADSDGSFSTDDGPPDWKPSITTHAVQINDKWFVFALYRSPPDFNRGGDEASSKRTATLSMTFTADAGSQFTQDIAIDLVRPPVIVVPDIWSSCLSWLDHGSIMDPTPVDPTLAHHYTVSCVDYQATSSKSFDDDTNRSVLADTIDQALKKLRDASVAVTRADVIGHGMGGLLARRYIDDDNNDDGSPAFLRSDNFMAGTINRLIMMSTPNLGSRMIDEMIRTRDLLKQNNPQLWTDTKSKFLDPVGVHFDNADQDVALQQMVTHSDVVNDIGTAAVQPSSVYYHAVVGTFGHSLTRTDAFKLLAGGVAGGIQHFILVMEASHPSTVGLSITAKRSLVYGLTDPKSSIIFCKGDPTPDADQHDLFATTTEQAGGLDSAFITTVNIDPAVLQSGHFNIQNDPAHEAKLIALLDAPVKPATGGKFTTSMLSPGPVSRMNDCPINPPIMPTDPPAILAPHALAQQTIAITSPAPGTLVTPGSLVSVTVDTGGGEQPDAVLIASTGSSVLLEQPPFTSSVLIPATATGTTPINALAFYADGGLAFADTVDLNIQLDAHVTSIQVINGDQVLRRPGRTRQLMVVGTYSDGVRRDITQPPLGTRYTVSQLSPVITVSDAGLITAVGPGTATLAITNGAAITSISVTVGDVACGDGVRDPDEECDDGNTRDGDGCDRTCHVEDRPPIAVCVSPTVCNDAGLCSASVTDLGAGSFDPDGDLLTITQSPAGPYSVGSHLVSVGVSDGRLDAQCTSQLDVLDCEPPQLTCPVDFAVECTAAGTAAVTPPPAAATDNCAVTVQAPGTDRLPLGTTALTYTATDPANNATSCTTRVTVQDTTPPTITCPAPIVAECTHDGRAFVRPGQAISSDACTNVTVTGPAPGLFPLGTTSVTYTSTDQIGHRASCSAMIQVVDTRPPHVETERTITLFPPDHRYHTVNLRDCGIEVEDACGGQIEPQVSRPQITCVTSDERDDERGGGDGHTDHDIVIVDDDTVKLRAERDPHRDGRAYRIHFEVRDRSGNPAEGVCKVVVPRDARCAEEPWHGRDPEHGHDPQHGCRIDGGEVESSVCRQ